MNPSRQMRVTFSYFTLCLAALVPPAFAATYTEGAWSLQTSVGNQSATGLEDCKAKWRVLPAPAKQRTDYCRLQLVTKVTNDPTPPPTCTTAQPPAETRAGQCPAGTTGSWTQSLGYISAPYPTCWIAGPWTPTDPPTDACKISPPPTNSTLVLYTDMVAAPIGAPVAVFGLNFGDAPVVKFDGMVAPVLDAKCSVRAGIDCVRVRFSGSGIVSVNGAPGNVVIEQPGDIYYVSTSGNDSTAVKNDPSKPFRRAQLASAEASGAMAKVQPGDVIMLRGGTYTDSAIDGAYIRFWRQGGTVPTGVKGTGYIAVTSYPGEAVIINAPKGGGVQGGGEAAPMGKYIVVSNLKIVGLATAASDGAPVNSQVHGDFWRVVNNDISWPVAPSGSKAGGVVGRFNSGKVLGNHIHHIAGGTLNHGVYIDAGSVGVELAYNSIHDVVSGNLVQTFDSVGESPLTGVEIHHNQIYNGGRYALNFSEGTRSAHVWNNLVYNAVYSGVRFNINEPAGSVNYLIEHNTFYNVCSNHPQEPGAVYNGWNGDVGTIKLQYNVFAKGSGGCANAYEGDGTASAIKFSRNLYFGYAAPKAAQTDPFSVSGNPLFRNAAGGDFSLGIESLAVDAAIGSMMKDDLNLKARSSPDLGAIEY
jgi:hypothetical protein